MHPRLWTPGQLDAIERRYPTHEERALVTEIRRLNAIAEYANDLVRALEATTLTTTPKLLLTALVERLEAPATGRIQYVGEYRAATCLIRDDSRPTRCRLSCA